MALMADWYKKFQPVPHALPKGLDRLKIIMLNKTYYPYD
jgi:hypothetical protein